MPSARSLIIRDLALKPELFKVPPTDVRILEFDPDKVIFRIGEFRGDTVDGYLLNAEGYFSLRGRDLTFRDSQKCETIHAIISAHAPAFGALIASRRKAPEVLPPQVAICRDIVAEEVVFGDVSIGVYDPVAKVLEITESGGWKGENTYRLTENEVLVRPAGGSWETPSMPRHKDFAPCVIPIVSRYDRAFGEALARALPAPAPQIEASVKHLVNATTEAIANNLGALQEIDEALARIDRLNAGPSNNSARPAPATLGLRAKVPGQP